jgi:hypothetical protein
MNRRYIPVLLTAFYWSAWAAIIWWDHHTPKVTDSQLSNARLLPAAVPVAITAQSSDVLSLRPAVQAKRISRNSEVSERQPVEAELFYDDPYSWVTVSRGVALHTEPLVSSPALDYQPRGQKFKLLRLENGWAEVVHPATKKRGWIWHIYLAPSKPVIAHALADSHDPKPQSPPDPTEERPQRASLEPNVEQVAHRGMVNPGEVKLHRKRFADFWPPRQKASVMRLGPAKMFKKRSLRKQARASRRHGLGIRGLFGRYR